jgi:DUF4097 and DUF4098 domain-containing protein YvlB
MFRYVATLFFAFSAVALGDSISKVNGSIRVDDGQSTGDVSTVNGAITVGRDARVQDVSTVNGSIRLEERAVAEEVGTVNGAIMLAEQVQVRDSAGTVNGEITLERGARVGGALENVNGKLAIHGAEVGGDIETVNGDVHVGAGSRVDGGIHVEKSEGWFRSRSSHKPRVTVESGAVVSGPLKFEREVELYLGDSATVGAIEGIPPERHSLP